MPAHWILDENGKPRPVDSPFVWAKWFETAERVIVRTVIHGVLVSTVFIGLDYNFSEEGPPLLYETMVFYPDNGIFLPCDIMQRYATEEEARTAHEEFVRQVIAAQPQPRDPSRSRLRSPNTKREL